MQPSITTNRILRQKALAGDPLGGLADLVAQRGSPKIVQVKQIRGVKRNLIDSGVLRVVLHEVLESPDEACRQIRGELQVYLAQVILNKDMRATPASADKMLSTEEAAQMMGRSRPYVAMLIDAGKVSGAKTTAGGHRRVPESSVKAWMRANPTEPASAKGYRQAGADTGLYNIPEAAFVAKTAKKVSKRG
ncbi:MAG: excisionase family DNA-binding protein [Limnohabitans sp.]